MLKTKTIKIIQAIVSNYFKNGKGEPYEITEGECEIFHAVTTQGLKWVWASAPTRYGKTEIVAMAVLYLASFHHLKVPIVAGSEDKAKKIMEYIVAHIGDHEIFYEGLLNINYSSSQSDAVDKLKVQMSKSALRWSTGGWIFVTSVDSRNIKKEGEGVVGEGGDVVILEEAGLITRKEQFSKIVRMPENNKGWGKLVMIGNCIEGSVFQTAFNDPLYYKVRITLEQAIREGRYTEKQLAEKKLQTTSKDWKRYYLVEFPAENEFTYFKPKKMEFLSKELDYYGTLDPSLGETAKSSMQGLVVLGVDKKTGQVYEVESHGLHVGPNEAVNTIFNMPYKFIRFGIEDIQFQKYFKQEMDKKSKELGLYIPFVGIHQRTKKLERIESLEPIINTGQILFRGDNLLWEHMQDYPEAEFLDILDSLEMCWRLVSTNKVDFAFA